MPEILYSDRSLCVAVKPSGVLSEPDGRSGGMPELLAAQLGGEVYTVHRLDRAVSGVMLFSRDSRVTGKLTAAVQAHEIGKEYFAILSGIPEAPTGELRDLLFRDAAKNKSYVVKRPRRGVREAVLRYELLSCAPDGDAQRSLVRIALETGRTHQIRVQFASRGLPLLGDGRYGGKDSRCEVALFSHALTFRHPVSKKMLHFSAAPPDAFPWNLFPRELLEAQ